MKILAIVLGIIFNLNYVYSQDYDVEYTNVEIASDKFEIVYVLHYKTRNTYTGCGVDIINEFDIDEYSDLVDSILPVIVKETKFNISSVVIFMLDNKLSFRLTEDENTKMHRMKEVQLINGKLIEPGCYFSNDITSLSTY